MPLDPKILQALAQANTGAFAKPTPLASNNNSANSALAHALLTSGSAFAGSSNSSSPKQSSQGQSVISRILDVLSRPLYATADAAFESEDAAANHESLWDQIKGLGTGAVHGLSGTEKRTWADVLQQGKDINAQKKATGDSAGYQQGQGGPLSAGDKIGAVALNIIADPSLTFNPLKTVRAFGEGSELYNLPTIRSLSKKVISKNPTAVEENTNPQDLEQPVLETPETQPTPPSMVQPERIKPASNLLNIDQNALRSANSVPNLLHQKLGNPVVYSASHPHVVLDPEALTNGEIKTASPHITPEGIKAAVAIRPQLIDIAQKKVDFRLQGLMQGPDAMSPVAAKNHISSWTANVLNKAANPRSASLHVVNKAVESLSNDIKPQLEHNQNWIKEAIKNGIDPQRALQVVKDVQAGDDFSKALNDAAKQSRTLSGSGVLHAGKLGESGKGYSANTTFRLSRILSPTPTDILDAVHPSNPSAAQNLETIDKVKALNSIKRSGAASSKLNPEEQALADEVTQKAVDKINGEKGFSPTRNYDDLTQSMVWNTVRSRLPSITRGGASNIRGVNERTLRVVAHIEDALAGQGFRATAADGTPIRLTDAVLNHSEFPDKLNSFPNRIINEYANGSFTGAVAKAEEATKEAAVVKPTVQKAALVVNQLFQDPALSDPVKHLLSQSTAKGVERSIVMNTGSTRAGLVGRQVFNAIVQNEKGAPQAAIENAGKLLTEIVSTGVIPKDYKRSIDQLFARIEETLQTDPQSVAEALSPSSGYLGPTWLVAAQARAETGFLGLMATWAGQHDVRSAVVRQLNTARTNAAVWTRYWHDTFENLDQPQRIEAMRSAQGHFNPVDTDVAKASQTIRSRFENLFSSSGLSAVARRGNTQALRTGMILNGKYGINAELKRAGSSFKFTNSSEAKDLFGNLHDYSNGTDWLNSWEVHKFGGELPREIARIETATFNYMAKKAIYDGIINEFASAIPTSVKNTMVKDIPFLKGMYFEPEMAQQLSRVGRDLYTVQHSSSPMLRAMDNILRLWKTSVTIYSPSHAIHNGMGDIYNNWIAGVNGVRPYSKAIRVMANSRNEYKNLERLGLYVNQDWVRYAGRGDERTLLRTADGQRLTASEIKIAAHNQGILQSVQHIEDIANAEGGIGALRFRPFGGKVNTVAHAWVQGMDHFTRLAHFIHDVEKGRGTLQEIFDKAGSEVRKFHPDGMDLTGFERNTLRRIIPFYAWTRKAIPFTIEGMLTKPGKFMVYPKVTAGINQGNAQNINPGQQFPSDQLFPSWLVDEGIGPWGSPGGILNQITGGPSGYVTGSLSIPPIDLIQHYQNPRSALGDLNPLVKTPLELMEGQHIDTGIPISNTSEYLGETVPIASLIQRLTNVGVGGVTQKGQTQGIGNQQALVNFLSGLKLTNTGQYIKQAQYEAHQNQTAQKKANRDHLASFLKSVNGG